MWILILIVLAVVAYFVMSQASSSNQSSKASSRTKASQVDYSNLEVSLDSSANTYSNYTRLRDLLAEGKWREADEETGKIIFSVGNSRYGEHAITTATHETTPCKDISTIDRLWLKYSNGRFGFSVQRRIILGIQGDALFILLRLPSERKGNRLEEMNKRIELQNNFHKLIGWYIPGKDGSGDVKKYNDLTFSIHAPYGHLPTAYWENGEYGESWKTKSVNGYILPHFLNRLSSCGIAL
ncbi:MULTISPECIES: GUN4 domain-containing protein [unclassified Microcoleus]|uniref:GUN4 domain-containing protein n=1 Tax=unclassified Microcoleus TaxID=2642155 RepID=UPI002FCFFE37